MTSNLFPTPIKVLWHIWRHPVWIIQLLCWSVLLVPLCAGPITPLYHYLHYALWGISSNLAQATLSLSVLHVTQIQIVSPAGDKSQHASTKRPGSPLRFSWSWIRWGTLIRGCKWLFSIVWWGGIVCVSCQAMILHDTLMVTINALIGQLNRIKSNLPAQHARKI